MVELDNRGSAPAGTHPAIPPGTPGLAYPQLFASKLADFLPQQHLGTGSYCQACGPGWATERKKTRRPRPRRRRQPDLAKTHTWVGTNRPTRYRRHRHRTGPTVPDGRRRSRHRRRRTRPLHSAPFGRRPRRKHGSTQPCTARRSNSIHGSSYTYNRLSARRATPVA